MLTGEVPASCHRSEAIAAQYFVCCWPSRRFSVLRLNWQALKRVILLLRPVRVPDPPLLKTHTSQAVFSIAWGKPIGTTGPALRMKVQIPHVADIPRPSLPLPFRSPTGLTVVHPRLAHQTRPVGR
jgi:hypothetical protein